ncbi:MAG TPA: type II toxin-antitoxin system VapC family toxin [Egibacteraceae bacterium]|nr:type II toxin-antitoxin system VapC family toxin [Egibacteraceae bacterium]
MGVIVADSSVLVDHLRGKEASRQALRSARTAGERVQASVLSRTELLVGMRAHQKRLTKRLVDQIEWIPVDEWIADRAGELGRAYRASHPGIGVIDLVIAATVERVRGQLWTSNVKHFPMFEDLAPPY